jgi:pyruvate dehydrogenase E1 component alpha subunit
MPSDRVDGMDVLKVHEAAEQALQHVRTKSEPFLLEVITYRYRGHSMGDPERYRSQDEVRKWQETDPIGIFRKSLTSRRVATAAQLDKIEQEVEGEVQRAVEFAETSPEPAAEALWEDIYATPEAEEAEVPAAGERVGTNGRSS